MSVDLLFLFHTIDLDYLLPPGLFCRSGLPELPPLDGIVALGAAGLVAFLGVAARGVDGLVLGVAGLEGVLGEEVARVLGRGVSGVVVLVGVTVRVFGLGVLGVATLVGETAREISAGFLKVLPL